MLLSAVDDIIFQYIFNTLNQFTLFVTHIDKEKSNSSHYLKINITLELCLLKKFLLIEF